MLVAVDAREKYNTLNNVYLRMCSLEKLLLVKRICMFGQEIWLIRHSFTIAITLVRS